MTKPKTDKQGWEEEFDNKVKEMPKKLIELVEWNKIKDFIRQLYQQALAEGKRIGREVAGLPEEVLFICPKCGTPQEGEITSKPQQQESWKLSILDRVVQLGNYLDTKHGKGVVIPDEWAAGLYKDIESLISAERQRVIEEVMELVDRYIENSVGTNYKSKPMTTKPKATKTNKGKGENTYYRVKDDCESPMVFEDLDGALEYLKSCLEGINDELPVSIEKVQMTENQFSELPEL